MRRRRFAESGDWKEKASLTGRRTGDLVFIIPVAQTVTAVADYGAVM